MLLDFGLQPEQSSRVYRWKEVLMHEQVTHCRVGTRAPFGLQRG